MLTPKVRDLEQRCHQAELAAVRLAEDPEGHGFALGGSRLVESTLGFIGRKVLAFEVRGHRRPDRPSNPPFPGPEAVRRARESFSSPSNHR